MALTDQVLKTIQHWYKKKKNQNFSRQVKNQKEMSKDTEMNTIRTLNFISSLIINFRPYLWGGAIKFQSLKIQKIHTKKWFFFSNQKNL